MTGDGPAIVMWHNVPTEIETIYTYRCCICKAEAKQSIQGSATYVPGYPGHGWMEYEPGTWICPDHDVKITVDGHVVHMKLLVPKSTEPA